MLRRTNIKNFYKFPVVKRVRPFYYGVFYYMKTITKPYYKCEHCNKTYLVSHACLKHEEKKCTKNPKNWDKCLSCAFAVCKTENIVIDIEDSEYGHPDTYVKTVNTYSCSMLEINMYPFKATTNNLPERFPEQFEDKVQMPNKCDHFKFK